MFIVFIYNLATFCSVVTYRVYECAKFADVHNGKLLKTHPAKTTVCTVPTPKRLFACGNSPKILSLDVLVLKKVNKRALEIRLEAKQSLWL